MMQIMRDGHTVTARSITGFYRSQEITVVTIGQTPDPHIFVTNSESFRGIRHRLHLPFWIHHITLTD